MEILLASGSPRRQSLLSGYGFDVTVVRPDFDEDSVLEKDPQKLVCALARGKLESVERGDMLTLAADETEQIRREARATARERRLKRINEAAEAF